MEEKKDALASKIVNYCLKIKENDRVLISTFIEDEFFIKRLIYYITLNKGIPFVRIKNDEINTYILETILDNRYKEFRNMDRTKCEKCSKCEYWDYCLGGALHTWDFKNLEQNKCTYNMIYNK